MKGKLFKIILFTSLVIVVGILGFSYILYQDSFYIFKDAIDVERIISGTDKNSNGIDDADDILTGARNEVKKKTIYKSAYYKGGFPPDDEGVCTDLVWRALKAAGYDFKSYIDVDIRENLSDYANSISVPDPNIDFRRVKNQFVFFKKYAQNLTLEVLAYNEVNLKQWQGGDIVVMKDSEHVAIISDKRRKDGVPYVIHNSGPYPKEEDCLMYWYKRGRIIGHFRYMIKDPLGRAYK